MHNMNRMTLMFLLIKKNTKLLREFIDCPTMGNPQKYLVKLKSDIAALPVEQYNLLKAIACNITRFKLSEPVQDFSKKEGNETVVRLMIHGTDKVLEEYNYVQQIELSMHGGYPKIVILHDTQLGIHFVAYDYMTAVDNVVIFTDQAHDWFLEVLAAINVALKAEEEASKERERFIAQQEEIQKKQRILQKYS